jgi:predicted nucleic acid-binding protein
VILLDTNVVSELMKPYPNPAVSAFIGRQFISELFVPSLAVAEIRFGLARLPVGHRRDDLTQAFAAFLEAGFQSRILPFDEHCVAGYAKARSLREQAGRPIQVLDALIGGMALTHGAILATRNLTDFDSYGLTLVNPWDES